MSSCRYVRHPPPIHILLATSEVYSNDCITHAVMADALEDNFVLSDDGLELASEAGSLDADGDEQHSILPPVKVGSTNLKGGNTETPIAKRKNNDNENEEEAARARKKLKRKAKKAKKAALNLATEPGAVARFPPDMQADHMLSLMRSCRAFAKLTDLEVDEVRLKETMLIDTTSLRMERTLDTLASFIQKGMPSAVENASHALRGNHATGEPCIIVVTGNAQRAADLSRALRSLTPSASSSNNGKDVSKNGDQDGASKGGGSKRVAVAKLFARHFKVTEQVQFLRSHICPLAVGTPQRLCDLLQAKSDKISGDTAAAAAALQLTRLQCIVLDASWCDQKQRTLLDGPETRQALFDFLSTDAVRTRLRAGGKKNQTPAKIALF